MLKKEVVQENEYIKPTTLTEMIKEITNNITPKKL